MAHPRPFYYLENFNTALEWLQQRYRDLLNEAEGVFIERFRRLPLQSSALLVRMLGRRGDLFRTEKLNYEEIGCARAASSALIEAGWVDGEPVLTAAELGRVLRKGEVLRAFASHAAGVSDCAGSSAASGRPTAVSAGAGRSTAVRAASTVRLVTAPPAAAPPSNAAPTTAPPTTAPPSTASPITAPPTTAPPTTAPPTTAPPTTAPPTNAAPTTAPPGWPLSRHARKTELLLHIESMPLEPRRLTEWWPDAPDVIFRVAVKPLCDRLRVLFFGNFHQDWSEFVLTDLGIFKYEQVPRDPATRAFQTRQHIDTFHALFECRQRMAEGDDLASIVEALPAPIADNDWLEGRRRKVQFQIAQSYEQQKDLERALALYQDCQYAGARLRSIRLLERLGDVDSAMHLAFAVREKPADEVEVQQIGRMWPRLQRKAGLKTTRARRPQGWTTFQLVLRMAQRPDHLESATGEALSTPEAPVYYVENGLLNSLFGLLCWQAIFAPVAGAFFHEFQAAPADLLAPDFYTRREAHFAECFAQLDSDAYRDTICRNFREKQGIQSPFVFWGVASEPLLGLALSCLPPQHLKACFTRILSDIRANRCGLPDLVQFWPRERRYRLIEVKGPGDRLQDNQVRWLSFCVAQGIPVSVCHVSWMGAAPSPDATSPEAAASSPDAPSTAALSTGAPSTAALSASATSTAALSASATSTAALSAGAPSTAALSANATSTAAPSPHAPPAAAPRMPGARI